MSVTQTIYARNTVSMTDLRRNPSEVIEVANLAPVAVLNH
ncbi:MAG: prevent-host-death protein, partial [Betaproteobacteria bacterium]|nr:prevent-host-death protein [Betaproteobacteria bacterium]